MTQIGPGLHPLLQRVRSIPPEVFSSEADLSAVIADFYRDTGMYQTFDANTVHNLTEARKQFFVFAIWLYLDPLFEPYPLGSCCQFFESDGLKYADVLDCTQIQNDSLRAEEFVRLCLKAVGLRPAGETEAQASDRLQTLDSVEAVALEKRLAVERERAKAVREQMQQAAAKAAAAKVSRE